MSPIVSQNLRVCWGEEALKSVDWPREVMITTHVNHPAFTSVPSLTSDVFPLLFSNWAIDHGFLLQLNIQCDETMGERRLHVLVRYP